MTRNGMLALLPAALALAAFPAAGHAAPPAGCTPIHTYADGSQDCARILTTPEGNHLGFYVAAAGRELTLLNFHVAGARMEPVDLSTYHNADFPGPKSGYAVRLAIPGKAPVVVYWRAEAGKLASFWEGG